MWYTVIFGYILPAIICTGRATHEYVKMLPHIRTEAEKKEALDKVSPRFLLGLVPIANIILAIRTIFD